MNEMNQEMNVQQVPLQLNKQSEAVLLTTAKWSKIMGIVSYVTMGLMVLMGLFMILAGAAAAGVLELEGMAVGLYGILYILFAALYFFPGWYLCHFSSNLRKALADRDEEALVAAFSYEKNFFVFMGVLCLIGVALVALTIFVLFLAVLIAAV